MNNAVFEIVDNKLVSTTKGMVVPENEPIFVLRARDLKSLSTIRCYQSLFTPTSHDWKVVQEVLDDFSEFRQKFPEKMKEPEDLY